MDDDGSSIHAFWRKTHTEDSGVLQALWRRWRGLCILLRVGIVDLEVLDVGGPEDDVVIDAVIGR